MKPSAERSYANFDLLVQRTGQGYSAQVIASPAGNGAHVEFSCPFTPDELAHLRSAIENPFRDLGRAGPDAEAMIEDFGMRLFNKVFTGGVRGCFDGALGAARAKGQGLRLQLRIVDPEVSTWPWEYLYDPAARLFLARAGDTSIVRYPKSPEPVQPTPIKLPLRILVVSSSPRGLRPVAEDMEYERLTSALGKLIRKRAVVMHRLKGATLASLEERLAAERPHILHFIGHGKFELSSGEGYLALQTPKGDLDKVKGSELGDLLSRYRLSLAVLNACEGARDGTESFSGISSWLARRGVPAVIAMQFAISDLAAVCFAPSFYGYLARGDSVDVALAEARRSLFAATHKVEWGTPVLSMRGDGRIFDVAPRKIPVAALALLSLGSLASLVWIGRDQFQFSPQPAPVPSKGPVTVPPPPPSDSRCPSIPELDMNFAHIEAGTFTMGSGKDKRWPAHQVTITEPFCIGRFEVTQKQWEIVFHENPSSAKGENRPVESITWLRAQEYVEEINRRHPEVSCRLAKEAQWEYAARAGSSATYFFGTDISRLPKHGNCEGGDGFEQTADVGSLLPNKWGLYDMYGNVAEWVEDRKGEYGLSPAVDPRGSSTGEDRIRRGGGWKTKKDNCNSFHRFSGKPDREDDDVGFRIVCDPLPLEKQKAAVGPPSVLQLFLP